MVYHNYSVGCCVVRGGRRKSAAVKFPAAVQTHFAGGVEVVRQRGVPRRVLICGRALICRCLGHVLAAVAAVGGKVRFLQVPRAAYLAGLRDVGFLDCEECECASVCVGGEKRSE